MCLCQVYGKSGVPNARGNCLVCGEPVRPTLTDPPTRGMASSTVGPPPELFGPVREDRCAQCGALIGFGIEAFHLGICDDCRAQASDDKEEA